MARDARDVRISSAIGFVLLATVALPGHSAAVTTNCDLGGDQIGSVVASGGDLDGDGVEDIAAAAPCARIRRTFEQAGRVVVYSGHDGRKLLDIRGEQTNQRLGAAIAFVPDRDGDGRDELAVGSTGWTDPRLQRNEAGKVDIYDATGAIVVTALGEWAQGRFGESVAGGPDVTGDGVPDLVVGAGRDRIGPGEARRGAAYLVSGADGSVIDASLGDRNGDSWGSVVAFMPDVNGDNIADVIVASTLADAIPGLQTGANGEPPALIGSFQPEGVQGGVGSSTTTSTSTTTSSTTSTTVSPYASDNGVIKVLSGADLTTELVVVSGEMDDDTLGRAVTSVDDTNGDGIPDFLAGATGADPGGRNKAGEIILFSGTGERLATFFESRPATTAGYGTALARIGDVDSDGVADFAGGAPGRESDQFPEAGRVAAVSLGGGAGDLWELVGGFSRSRMGQSLASIQDLDGDTIGDLVIGVPGEPARGRRGSGSVLVVSGADGSELFRFSGRRGRATRLFIAGWAHGGRSRLASFQFNGRRGKMRAEAFRNLRDGDMSVAVLDEPVGVDAGTLKVVVGSAEGSRIRIYAAGRRRKLLSDLDSFGPGHNGGVEVASGDTRGVGEDSLVVAQARRSGDVRVKALSRFETDPAGRITWRSEDWNVLVFDGEDQIEGVPVEAGGAYVAVGDLGDPAVGEEVVVGTRSGCPCVRVLDGSGNRISEWLAYGPEGNEGMVVAVGDIDGDGREEVLTVPSAGQPWVKGFDAQGNPYTPIGALGPVSFFFPTDPIGNTIRLAVADVDLDGKGEILISSVVGGNTVVAAFEPSGARVQGWKNFRPFGPTDLPAPIAASDYFWGN